MKKIIYISIIGVILAACVGGKRVEKHLPGYWIPTVKKNNVDTFYDSFYAGYMSLRRFPPDTLLFTEDHFFYSRNYASEEFNDYDTSFFGRMFADIPTPIRKWYSTKIGFNIKEEDGLGQFVVLKINKRRLKLLYGDWPILEIAKLKRVVN